MGRCARAHPRSRGSWAARPSRSTSRSGRTACCITSTSWGHRSPDRVQRPTSTGRLSAVISANPTERGRRHHRQLRRLGVERPDGDPLSYAWDLDGDGAFDDAATALATWTYNAAGAFRVSLQVGDGQGGTATETSRSASGFQIVTIASRTTSSSGRRRHGVILRLGDRQQGAPNPLLESDLEARTQARRLSRLPRALPADLQRHQQGSFNAPDHEYPSELELTLTATDSAGRSKSASIRLLPRTTTLTFQTSPTGLKLTFNGVNATAPFSRTVIVGSSNSVSAPSPQTLRGKQIFRSWADGVTTLSRTIIAPASAVTYTATFTKK